MFLDVCVLNVSRQPFLRKASKYRIMRETDQIHLYLRRLNQYSNILSNFAGGRQKYRRYTAKKYNIFPPFFEPKCLIPS